MIRKLKNIFHLFVAIIAALWYRFPARKLTVIGVTGTDGKTTTSMLIYSILKEAGYKVSVISSVETWIGEKRYDTGLHVTTAHPFKTQWFLNEVRKRGSSHIVLEVTSHGLHQHRVFGVRFAIGVLTNVTHEHLDYHKTYESYLRTKLILLQRADIAVFNRDEANVYREALHVVGKKKHITYGIKHEAVITPQTYPFTTKLPGEFNIYNCLAALSVARVLRINDAQARKAVSNFKGVAGRMEVVISKPITVIIDFAHTPNALEQVFQTIKDKKHNKIISVFGCAGLRDKTKRPLMGKIAGRYADIIVLTEEDYRTENLDSIFKQIASGVPRNIPLYQYKDREKAINFAISQAKRGDIILITGKGHEQSLSREKTEYPYSEHKAVKEALRDNGYDI